MAVLAKFFKNKAYRFTTRQNGVTCFMTRDGSEIQDWGTSGQFTSFMQRRSYTSHRIAILMQMNGNTPLKQMNGASSTCLSIFWSISGSACGSHQTNCGSVAFTYHLCAKWRTFKPFVRYFSSCENELEWDADEELYRSWQQIVTIDDFTLKKLLFDSDVKCSIDSSCIESASDCVSILKEALDLNQFPQATLLISSTLFPKASIAFQKYFCEFCLENSRDCFLDFEPLYVKKRVIFPLFTKFCEREFPEELQRYKAMFQAADLTKIHLSFPSARAIKRRIYYHHGPTNSGKTYTALQRFLQAPDGIYCSPLRLLAMEVYDTANGKGVLCTLLTGQEKKEVDGAKHISCTIEMALLQHPWKVAIIDEVQLLNDDDRGWAWTRALLGLQAEEIHLCGDPSALPVVRSICTTTGDELMEYSYSRFTPLVIDYSTYNGSFQHAKPGDCIVAFSRHKIFEIKRAVQRATWKRCCVVYGALPPETRAQQAKLFNEPSSSYSILVASDAVGMGLNLNIRRVVFYTLEKFGGDIKRRIPVSLVKQIAGRAGRRGSIFSEGLVTTFHLSDLPYLKACLEEPFSNTCNAGLFPSYEMMHEFAKHMPNATFSELLERFAKTCHVDDYYFLCNNRCLRKLASVIDMVESLTLEERFIFCFAPVNTRNSRQLEALSHYATLYSKKLPLPLLTQSQPPVSIGIDFQLMDMEDNYQLLSLYLWLSQHFPADFFPQKAEAERMAAEIARVLGHSLENLND